MSHIKLMSPLTSGQVSEGPPKNTSIVQPLRMTKQRNSVLQQLQQASGFQSAQQIHAALSASGIQIGLATVYRSLTALSANHEIDELKTAEGETLYRHCATNKHHHHLVCRECGKTKEITGPSLEHFLTSVAKTEGFTDLEHVIEIWGTCSNCREPHTKTKAA